MQCPEGYSHPCGRCLSCRINKRRVWAARLMLEAQCHEHSFFSTFTYEVPPSGNTLVKAHVSDAIKRLRERARGAGRTVRFYACGEYGEHTLRPHYHACIFGLGPEHVSDVEAAWLGLRDPVAIAGFSSHGVLGVGGANYVTGYVTKKLASVDADKARGVLPEFAVMSRRPGLGLPALIAVIEALNTSAGALYLARNLDVPVAFQVSGRLMPLGSYLRQKLRLFFFGDHREPIEAGKLRERKALEETLPPLFLDASPYERALLFESHPEVLSSALKTFHATKRQKVLIERKRTAIYSQRKSI